MIEVIIDAKEFQATWPDYIHDKLTNAGIPLDSEFKVSSGTLRRFTTEDDKSITKYTWTDAPT